MIHNYRIIEQNILLRSLEIDDLEIVRKWRNKDEIRKWFINDNLISSEKQLLWYEKYKNKKNELMFIIEEKNELKMSVGAISLYNINYKKAYCELGRLMIGENEARGKGIGLIASKALCNFGFIRLNLEIIYLKVFFDNIIAINIYKKIGFNETRTSLIKGKKIVRMEIKKILL